MIMLPEPQLLKNGPLGMLGLSPLLSDGHSLQEVASIYFHLQVLLGRSIWSRGTIISQQVNVLCVCVHALLL